MNLYAYYLAYARGNPGTARRRIAGNLAGTIKDDRLRRMYSDGVANNCESRMIKKAELRIFGHALRDTIRDDVPEAAIELINGSRLRYLADWVDRLDSMFSEHFESCHDCNNISLSGDMHEAYNGDYEICQHCRDSNYFWSDRRDTLIRDDDDEPEELPEDSIIGEYHSSRHHLGHIPSEYDKRNTRVLLGLELEMECDMDNYDRETRAEYLIANIGSHESELPAGGEYTYAMLEQDGSLSNGGLGGFEMVTGYTGLDVHAKQLAFFKNKFAGMTSHNTRTCGLHVHVCKAGMSLLHAAKLVLFINDAANLPLIKTIARRTESNYCAFIDKKENKQWIKDALECGSKRSALRNLNRDRYEALNFKNDNTIEFRLFKSSLKFETIMSCLEFSFIAWFFARDTSQQQLNTDNFLQYICLENNRHDTRYLRAYLHDKGWQLPFSPKADSRQQTAAPAATNQSNKEEL